MSITVVTPEGEALNFDAADWEIGQDEGDLGNLTVGSGLTNVAEFARGAWSFVYEAKEIPTEESKPRVWDLIHEVPPNLLVLDNSGDEFRWRGGSLEWNRLKDGDFKSWGVVGPSFDTDLSPFTEVL